MSSVVDRNRSGKWQRKKSTTKTEQKPYQTPSQASLLNIYINSNCIATRVNVDNCTFKATVQPYNQFLCSNCTYFHKKNVNII